MGRIEFEVRHQACRFLNPTCGFEPVEKAMEIRGDSLTGRTTHVADAGFGLERPDVEGIVARARADFNPFTPYERSSRSPRASWTRPRGYPGAASPSGRRS